MGGPVRKRVAVLISGRGSNLTALIEAAASPDYPAEIVVVISSRQDAPGLEVASSTGIRTAIIEPGLDNDRHKWERDLHDQLKRAEVDIVCLAGYMQVLSADFVRRWPRPHHQHTSLAAALLQRPGYPRTRPAIRHPDPRCDRSCRTRGGR